MIALLADTSENIARENMLFWKCLAAVLIVAIIATMVVILNLGVDGLKELIDKWKGRDE